MLSLQRSFLSHQLTLQGLSMQAYTH